MDIFEPGAIVRNPARPEWGDGQVQSSVNGRVCVMFENAGKQVVDVARVRLEVVAGM